jgi:hypothetical protein
MKERRNMTLLTIYLNDHLAALITGRELARRLQSAAGDDDQRSLATDLLEHFLDSEHELERLLIETGSRPSPLKGRLAWAAEKAGRLKLNGHITSRSPLSDLVELEGLTVLLEYELAAWRSLQQLASPPELARASARFAAREEQARTQRNRCAEQSQQIAAARLNPATATTPI